MPDAPSARRHPHDRAGTMALPSAIWMLMFFIIPVAVIMVFGFSRTDEWGDVAGGFTFYHYREAFDPLYLAVLWRSLGYAAASTVLTLLVAYPAALYIAFSPVRRQKQLLFLVFLPLWTNLLVRLYAFVVILGDSGLINQALQAAGLAQDPIQLLNTPAAVLIGFVYWNLPFMIPPIYAALCRMDTSLLEASMDLGATRGFTFRHVILPRSMPGVAAGTALCFIPALGCFIVPEILGGPDTMMLGNLITAQFQQGRNWPFGSALAGLLMLLVMAGACLYLRHYDPSGRPAKEVA